MKQQVAVVIPIYKTQLKASEITSLERCKRILKNYPIIFVAPEGLQASYTEGYAVFEFESRYFEGISGYNALMMSSDFYTRFLDFDYMLLYQLDALVWKDELAYWCAKGYDYIGATWLDIDRNIFRRLKRNISTWLYINKMRGKQFAEADIKMGYTTHNKVGNGGFSLRRVSAMLRIAEAYPAWIQRILEAKIPEDVFFSILVNLYEKRQLKIASYREGIAFAFEMHPEKAYKINGYQLPFGCHDFDDWNYAFWEDILEKNP